MTIIRTLNTHSFDIRWFQYIELLLFCNAHAYVFDVQIRLSAYIPSHIYNGYDRKEDFFTKIV
jgi:hypothetical protein